MRNRDKEKWDDRFHGYNYKHIGRQANSFCKKTAGLPPKFFRSVQMKLHDNQLDLLQHLARFNLLDYLDCLELLDTAGTGDRAALSYAFRPLTKNGYVSKRKDGCVSILAKGRALFPDTEPLISTRGGAAERRRVMEVSRMAAWMERSGIPRCGERQDSDEPYFIPSACWRKLAPGILSTTRFAGIIVNGGSRVAVYDIGDGHMEWQARAEGSLFYTRYGSYETKATGMLLVCQEDARAKAGENIIRHTMWSQRQDAKHSGAERNKPVAGARSPIKLKARYEHAYLTTPRRLAESLQRVWEEDEYIEALMENGSRLRDPAQGDIELWPRRLFVNPACDLLKFFYFYAAVKAYRQMQAGMAGYHPYQLNYELYIYPEDDALAHLYRDVEKMEEATFYHYRPDEDGGDDQAAAEDGWRCGR